MKTRRGLVISLIIIAILLGGLLFYQNYKASSDPYQTENHISQDEAIAALNANNIEAETTFVNISILLKNSHQWFTIDGDGKKYLEAKKACGQKCWLIPQVIP